MAKRNPRIIKNTFNKDDKLDPDVVRCQTAQDIKRIVDDNLIFLIVMLACTLNTIFQSTVPLFHGKNISLSGFEYL